MKIAVIGAGITGATLAYFLKEKADVHVFEKARGVGGRMSTRYAGDYEFDHGAQYFTATTTEFHNFILPFIHEGSVTRWDPVIKKINAKDGDYVRCWTEHHYVGSPRMNDFIRAILKRSINDDHLYIGTRIVNLNRDISDQWNLEAEDGAKFSGFDHVISTLPPPQVIDLFPQKMVGIEAVKQVPVTANFSLMLGLKKPLNIDWDVAEVRRSKIGWIAVNNSKPERDTAYSLLVRSNEFWGQKNFERARDEIEYEMILETEKLLNQPMPEIAYKSLHGWRYAKAQSFLGQNFITDKDLNLSIAGDWCLGCRAESGFLSALALAKNLS